MVGFVRDCVVTSLPNAFAIAKHEILANDIVTPVVVGNSFPVWNYSSIVSFELSPSNTE